ncbi:MAG: triose-phosphate isomerase [Desulfobulbaceae bacterium A2]|nr:MAG: triose-phosphate isomerase [Desulfobulbaceae bacterium A2]
MRRPLIAGNWKMYLRRPEAVALARAIAAGCAGLADREVLLAPSFTLLAPVAEALLGSTVLLGAQNLCWEEEGAYTGEVAPGMLHECGVRMAIVGHSERRHIFHETDAIINRRVQGALRHGLPPILCLGETLDQREAGATFQVLAEQLRGGLAEVPRQEAARVVLAYEPVWAIGTGRTASEAQAQEVHAFLRQELALMYEKELADAVRILYGGSVKPDNVDGLMAQTDIDGALVGGASLKAESFLRIIQYST